MQTYDAFVARVSALGDGCGDARTNLSSDDRGSNPAPSTSRESLARLATLPECYDAYVALHRGGLWFDINPFWHPELRCYYLRCEPNRATTRLPGASGDQERKGENPSRDALINSRENEGTMTNPSRARAVIVPVAKSRGFVSHATLREVSRLGDDWRRETEQRVETRDDDGFGPTESIEANEGATFDGFAGDPPPAVATSLCVVDGDGVAVVVAVARGLVEPEECDSAVKDDDTLLSSAFANEDDAFDDAARVKAGPVVMGDASDDEESLLDERDAGQPDLGVADRGRE